MTRAIDYKHIILALLCLIFLIYIVIKNNRVLTVYRFFRDTCPYCVNSQDAWDRFKKSSGCSVLTIDIDMNNPSDLDATIAESFNMSTVPTIVAFDKYGRRFSYNGDRSERDLLQWADEIKA